TTGALAGDAHPLAALDACRDLHIDLAARPLPAPAVAGRARLALDVAGAVTARAGLVVVERERSARAAEGFLERDLDVRLHILATTGAAGPEQVLRVDAHAPPGAATAEVAEHCAEELREVPEVAEITAAEITVVGRKPAGGAWSGSGVALPVGAEGVVALALLRIRENFVGLADFFEPLVSVLRLG